MTTSRSYFNIHAVKYRRIQLTISWRFTLRLWSFSVDCPEKLWKLISMSLILGRERGFPFQRRPQKSIFNISKCDVRRKKEKLWKTHVYRSSFSCMRGESPEVALKVFALAQRIKPWAPNYRRQSCIMKNSIFHLFLWLTRMGLRKFIDARTLTDGKWKFLMVQQRTKLFFKASIHRNSNDRYHKLKWFFVPSEKKLHRRHGSTLTFQTLGGRKQRCWKKYAIRRTASDDS